MPQSYQVLQQDAQYAMVRGDGDAVLTPNGRPLQSKNRNYLLFLKRHLNRLGEEVDNGLTPYALAATYLDFGNRPSLRAELTRLLLDELRHDLLLSEAYSPCLGALHQQHASDIDVAGYAKAISQLNALPLWVLVQYVANYDSVLLGYSIIVTGIRMPGSVAELFGQIVTRRLLAVDPVVPKYSVRSLYPALASGRKYVPGRTAALPYQRLEEFQRKRFEKRVAWARQVASYGDID